MYIHIMAFIVARTIGIEAWIDIHAVIINSVPVHYNVTPRSHTHQFISLSLKSNLELYTILINLPNSMRNWFMIGHNRNTTYSTCLHAPILTLIKHLFIKDDLDAGAMSLGAWHLSKQ